MSKSPHVPDLDNEGAALARFEGEIWRATGRKLSALEVDRICIAHERYVERAVLAALADQPRNPKVA